eukprot:3299335-Rhodomonas_salina.2
MQRVQITEWMDEKKALAVVWVHLRPCSRTMCRHAVCSRAHAVCSEEYWDVTQMCSERYRDVTQ